MGAVELTKIYREVKEVNSKMHLLAAKLLLAIVLIEQAYHRNCNLT